MKLGHVIFYSLIFLGLVCFSAHVVTKQLTGTSIFEKPLATLTNNMPTTNPTVKNTRCTDQALPNRPTSLHDPNLNALREYEQVCQSQFADYVMMFTSMPVTDEDASTLADELALRLQKFSNAGVKPMVIVEPDGQNGAIDFKEYAKGTYDQFTDKYFAALKSKGITDEQLGLWTPFPEPQMDFWSNNEDPDDFANNYNRHVSQLRKYFPSAKTAILLDAQVGEEDRQGQLLAYTRLVEPSLVSVVGLQGFPWNPTVDGDKREPVTSAKQFAPAPIISSLAKALQSKEVLINTGSYRHRLMKNGESLTINQSVRQATMDSILTQVKELRKEGYDVTVNIFAENKLESGEAVDWSYWPEGQTRTTAGTALFTSFVHQLSADKVKVSIYDSRS